MLLLGKSDADTAWVEENNIPVAVLREYETNSNVSIHLQEKSISGQMTVTAVTVGEHTHTLPLAKKQELAVDGFCQIKRGNII